MENFPVTLIYVKQPLFYYLEPNGISPASQWHLSMSREVTNAENANDKLFSEIFFLLKSPSKEYSRSFT